MSRSILLVDIDNYDKKQAKQRASIKWLLSKAYNHKTPEELREPFYSDHNGVDQLKPHIVHALANAELYCMALSHLYQDPNYHNLNHWGIIQALARKGIYVAEPTDCSLTETVLIQTTPLKMSAHMAVIASIMSLFIKETVSPERVLSSIRRWNHGSLDAPSSVEEALLTWITKSGEELRRKESSAPACPRISELSDLSDGVGLATLLSLYLPNDLEWSEIAVGSPTSMADSLYNIQLVQRFCHDSLPFDVCHFTIEDLVYMHSSIKQNVVCFLVDLFYYLELRPEKNVLLPGVKRDRIIEVPDPDAHRNGIRRQSSVQDKKDRKPSTPSRPESRTDSADSGSDFVVQRGRQVPTLFGDKDKVVKEQLNADTKSDERGESDSVFQQLKQIPVAGRPSDSPRRLSSYAGRRSRRNSVDDNASQLSVENLGGSQNDLTLLGRNPDKEMRTATKFIDNRELEEMEKQEREGKSEKTGSDRISFADLRKQKARDTFHTSGINITYTEQEKEDAPKRTSISSMSRKLSEKPEHVISPNEPQNSNPDAMAAQLNSVRLKLEQRRKRIEDEKKKMENVMAKQREKDMTDDLSAVQTRWLSDRASSGSVPRTPDIEAMDMETYSKSLTAMNDSLHDLQSDIQRLANQQSQIQEMMKSSPQRRPTSQQEIQNPMDPQPFYIAEPAPAPQPQRRTWGQPQPITFAQQHGGHMVMDPPGWRRWGGAGQQPLRPMMNFYGQPNSSQYGGGADPYWGQPPMNPMGQMGPSPMSQMGQMGQPPPMGQPPMGQPYNYDPYYSPSSTYTPSSTYNPSSNYSPYSQYSGVPGSTAVSYTGPQPQNVVSSPVRGQPFRLHDHSTPTTTTPRPLSRQNSSSSRVVSPTGSMRGTSVGTTVHVGGSGAGGPVHTPVPAPEEDDMAPQNVSFIDSSTEDEPDRKLPDKLSGLNISSGSKTYRVHSDKESSPSPTRTRPTISSAFKQNRRGSGGETSGPSSLRSNSGNLGLTEEEQETLRRMRTERLAEEKEAGTGFVISFDDGAPKKPKPALKQRRLSSKKNSVSEMSSDGSNSSRKENVPPEVMICIDMNEGEDSGGGRETSPYRKYSPMRNGSPSRSIDSNWQSYDPDPIIPLPKFDVDPDVPLEPMIPLGDAVSGSESDGPIGLIIGDQIVRADPMTQDEMQRKKERIMMQSMKRKQQQEENRIRKEEETRRKREEEAKKEEEKQRKKEEQEARRAAILEQHRLKKEMEKAEEEGLRMPEPVSAKPVPKLRPKSATSTTPRPRPKTIHVDKDADIPGIPSARGKRGSSSNISGLQRAESRGSINGSNLSLAAMGRTPSRSNRPGSRPASRGPSRRGSTAFLDEQHNTSPGLPPSGALSSRTMDWAAKQAAAARRKQSVEDSPRMSRMDRSSRSMSQPRGKRDSSVSSAYGADEPRLASSRYRGGSRESLSGATYTKRRGSNASMYEDQDYYYGGSMRDLSASRSGRRKSSSASHLGPGSLPGYRRRGPDFDDGASDISSASGFSAYGYRSGTRLYREPASKSNRTIILNAIEYVVFPGVVNQDTRERVLNVIDRCDCPHFLLLFRDQKCQFRGLYAYYPDTDEVYKIYGTGPKQVTANMYDCFFKYNSGGKKFTKIHTKHLTVTIDAFTIHNSLWLGKKAKLPDKREMALVF